MEVKKLDFGETLKDSVAIGVKNAPSVIAAVALWLITIWIPYLNVGTTIAITLLPTQLAKGEIVNPLGIFDSKYRRYMGEFFITMGLMVFPIFIGVLFMVIPGIVLSIAWTLSYYFLIEKGKNPIQCCSASYSAFSRPSATRSASASSRSSSCSSSTCWPSRSQCPSALHSGNS